MARNLGGDERVLVFQAIGLDEELLHLWEDICMMMCRYAHQGDLDRVERWPIHLLYTRHAALTRVMEGEGEAMKNG